MSLTDLRRRLERIEAIHVVEAPRAILADRPMDDAEGAAALRDWLRWTADGRASLHRGVLCISDRHEPTDAEWTALYARPDSMSHPIAASVAATRLHRSMPVPLSSLPRARLPFDFR